MLSSRQGKGATSELGGSHRSGRDVNSVEKSQFSNLDMQGCKKPLHTHTHLKNQLVKLLRFMVFFEESLPVADFGYSQPSCAPPKKERPIPSYPLIIPLTLLHREEHKALSKAHHSTGETVIKHKFITAGQETITSYSDQELPTYSLGNHHVAQTWSFLFSQPTFTSFATLLI